MDQRKNLINWLLASFLVWMIWLSFFGPQRQQPQNPPPPAGAPPLAQDAAAGEDAEQAEDAPALPAPAKLDAPTTLATLGSLDYDSGYRMLVTLSSAGGSVVRAELSSPQCLDQDERSGYLGELALSPVAEGLRVNVVGPGTPAAQAGLAPGDVIVSTAIGPKESADNFSVSQFHAILAKSEPGEEIALQIRRGDDATQTKTATLVRRPFAVLRPEIENFQMRGQEPPADFVDRPSFLLALVSLGERKFEGVELQRVAEQLAAGGEAPATQRAQLDYAQALTSLLDSGEWQLSKPNENTVEFTRPIEELRLTLVKRYTLLPVPTDDLGQQDYPQYHVQLEVEVRNTSEEPQLVAYRLDGPTGMPTEGWWYARKVSRSWSAAGSRDVIVRYFGRPVVQLSPATIVKGDVEPMGEGNALAFAGVDGQYFSAVMIPDAATPDNAWINTTEAVLVGPKLDRQFPVMLSNVTCRLTRRTVELAPGASHTDSFRIFLGPKRPKLLAQYHPGNNPDDSLADVVYYGWPIFATVARAMLLLLHGFYSIVGNYGVAIVMLTILVRGALFPLSWKQTQSMARMQALKPEMDRINEKYKGDVQKRSQEIQALYRKNGVNPMAGCLPVLLQMPIFVGLYKGLMVDVELRGSALLSQSIQWCSNLAAPDMLYDWSGFMPNFVNRGDGIFGLGPYFNILPLITVGLFLVTQKLSMPPAANEQAEMQQKMMKYMTVFFGLLFYKVASGLCLYFIASSLWGIAERKMLKKSKDQDALTAESEAKPLTAAEKLASRRTHQPGENGASEKKKRSKPRKK